MFHHLAAPAADVAAQADTVLAPVFQSYAAVLQELTHTLDEGVASTLKDTTRKAEASTAWVSGSRDAASSAVPLMIQAILVPDASGRIVLPAGASIDDQTDYQPSVNPRAGVVVRVASVGAQPVQLPRQRLGRLHARQLGERRLEHLPPPAKFLALT